MPADSPKINVSINGTAIVLAAAALVAFIAGGVQAAWVLVWVYLASVVLLAAAIAWIGSDANGHSVSIGKEPSPPRDSPPVARGVRLTIFSAWVAVTAVAFIYLAFAGGHLLLLFPALSLSVVVLPGASERLLVDEYIRTVLVRSSSVAHAAALAGGFMLLVAARPGSLELFAVMVAVYAIVMEWAVWRELR